MRIAPLPVTSVFVISSFFHAPENARLLASLKLLYAQCIPSTRGRSLETVGAGLPRDKFVRTAFGSNG